MDWPIAFIFIVGLAAGAGVISEYIKGRARTAQGEAELRAGEQYRSLVADYQTLSKEIRDSQAALQADLAECRKKVEAIEKMMREVG